MIMAIKTIITYPHPVLREKAKKITVFDQELKNLVEDMADTMYKAPGVGLAANQIGIARQAVVVDRSTVDHQRTSLTPLNPEITFVQGIVVASQW